MGVLGHPVSLREPLFGLKFFLYGTVDVLVELWVSTEDTLLYGEGVAGLHPLPLLARGAFEFHGILVVSLTFVPGKEFQVLLRELTNQLVEFLLAFVAVLVGSA